jgi:hypothetical protein
MEPSPRTLPRWELSKDTNNKIWSMVDFITTKQNKLPSFIDRWHMWLQSPIITLEKLQKTSSRKKHHMTPNYNDFCILPMAKGDFFHPLPWTTIHLGRCDYHNLLLFIWLKYAKWNCATYSCVGGDDGAMHMAFCGT